MPSPNIDNFTILLLKCVNFGSFLPSYSVHKLNRNDKKENSYFTCDMKEETFSFLTIS